MLSFTVKTEKKFITIEFNIEDVKGVRGGYGCRCCKIIWNDKNKEPFNAKMYNKQLRMWFLEQGHEVNVL